MACFLRNSSTLLDAPTDWRKTCASKPFSLGFGPFAIKCLTEQNTRYSLTGRSGLYANVRRTDIGKADDLFGVQTRAASGRGWYEDAEQRTLQGTQRARGSRRRSEETEKNRQRNQPHPQG